MPSLDSLLTPANGQILALSGPLSKAAVEAVFKVALTRASGRAVVRKTREKRTSHNGDYWASLVSFPVAGPPAFFPHSHLMETTYAFLLLVEIKIGGHWYLGIFRHSCPSLSDWIDAHATNLPHAKLANAFSGGAAIRKLSIQRMTVSKHELRAASYEAADLQTSLPMMSAGRCVIRSVRFNDDTFGSVSVTINTSRVQRSGGRCSVEDIAELVFSVADATIQAPSNAFLGTFAQAIPLHGLPAGTAPNSVLFDWSSLLEGDGIELRRKPAGGQEFGREVRKRLLTRLLGEIIPLAGADPAYQLLLASGKPLGAISKMSTRYSLKSILGGRLVVRDVQAGESMPLAKWVRENDAYSITFNQPAYFFCGGALYHRADFASEVNAVRRCLLEIPALTAATSEKGITNANSSGFPVDSVFRIAEDSIYQNHDWLCCTDLGDEWADYLCIRDAALLFIHCKHGKVTAGASSFQEVVGQGLKNIGRVRSMPTEFVEKLKSFHTNKNEKWGGTEITRLRDAGRTWADFQNATFSLITDPDAKREIHLVVTMLSLASFDSAAAAVAPAPYFIQQIWILASFINTCREMGAKPVIVCKP